MSRRSNTRLHLAHDWEHPDGPPGTDSRKGSHLYDPDCPASGDLEHPVASMTECRRKMFGRRPQHRGSVAEVADNPVRSSRLRRTTSRDTSTVEDIGLIRVGRKVLGVC